MKNFFITAALCAALVNFSVNADEKLEKDSKKFQVGVGFDTLYLAPLIEGSYKIYEYASLRIGFQYTITSKMKNISLENKLSKELGIYANKFKYTNFAIPVVLDFYPLDIKLRVSAGIGYMSRKFHITKQTLFKPEENANKIFFIAGIGYSDFFVEGNNLGYSLDIKCNMLNKRLEDTKKDQWTASPTITVGLTYSI